MPISFQPPLKDCPLCPRLCQFRQDNKQKFPEYWNGPVPSFGSMDSRLLVVGLAPGLHGANATGRPFTGDYAGLVLYSGLKTFGFANGLYKERADDGFTLQDCRITNSVRCVPQENKPETSEIKNCNQFLINEIKAMPNLTCILSLGLVSHNAVLKAFGLKAGFGKFEHGRKHALNAKLALIDSYHCSRYNINTGRLTQAMFDEAVGQVRAHLI